MADYADVIEARIRTERGDLTAFTGLSILAMKEVFSPARICEGCGTHNHFHAVGCQIEREELDAAIRSDRELATGEREFEPGGENE